MLPFLTEFSARSLMHQKVVEFQTLFLKLFTQPDPTFETFTMKVHYIFHYSESTDKVGPLINQCSLKGERFIE